MSNLSENIENNENSKQNSQSNSQFHHIDLDDSQYNSDHLLILENNFETENFGNYDETQKTKQNKSQEEMKKIPKENVKEITKEVVKLDELKNEEKNQQTLEQDFKEKQNLEINLENKIKQIIDEISGQNPTKNLQNPNKKSIISIIIPCFNEEENIQDCYNELLKVWTKLPLYDYEFVFVNDGSSDFTVLAITKLQLTDNRVKLIEFSRNFGKEIAISAGFRYCNGEAAMIVDADLQYPVEKIPEFITLWENGSEVVIGLRDKKKTANLIEKYGSKLFYWIMGKIGEIKIIPGALDFRLIDREIIDHFNTFTERNRMARALVDWLGFDRSFVNYQEKPRNKGTASYSFGKRLKLATESFILHSLFPLKFAGYLGIFITVFAGFVGLSALINQFVWNRDNFNFSGAFLLGLLNLFLIGIVLICLGLIALYIANIHTEVVNRPLFVVKTNRAKTQNRMSVIVKD